LLLCLACWSLWAGWSDGGGSQSPGRHAIAGIGTETRASEHCERPDALGTDALGTDALGTDALGTDSGQADWFAATSQLLAECCVEWLEEEEPERDDVWQRLAAEPVSLATLVASQSIRLPYGFDGKAADPSSGGAIRPRAPPHQS